MFPGIVQSPAIRLTGAEFGPCEFQSCGTVARAADEADGRATAVRRSAEPRSV